MATRCPSTTSGPDPGELPGFCGSMVFCHAPIPRKGSGDQQQQQQQQLGRFLYRVLVRVQRVLQVRVQVRDQDFHFCELKFESESCENLSSFFEFRKQRD